MKQKQIKRVVLDTGKPHGLTICQMRCHPPGQILSLCRCLLGKRHITHFNILNKVLNILSKLFKNSNVKIKYSKILISKVVFKLVVKFRKFYSG